MHVTRVWGLSQESRRREERTKNTHKKLVLIWENMLRSLAGHGACNCSESSQVLLIALINTDTRATRATRSIF